MKAEEILLARLTDEIMYLFKDKNSGLCLLACLRAISMLCENPLATKEFKKLAINSLDVLSAQILINTDSTIKIH